MIKQQGSRACATDSFLFTATATSHALSFVDVTFVGEASALIDNISISAVPEPGTAALVLTALSGLGLSARRRSTPPSARASPSQ